MTEVRFARIWFCNLFPTDLLFERCAFCNLFDRRAARAAPVL